MTRSLFLALALLALAACGDSGTDPKPLGGPALAVVPGTDNQSAVAGTAELPQAVEIVAGRLNNGSAMIVARPAGFNAQTVGGADTVVSNLTPIVGAIVNFVVPDTACGGAFAGSALTDASGHAKERWQLGTKAGVCVMEARLVDQTTGAPLVVDQITATILPDVPHQIWDAVSPINPMTVTAGTSTDIHSLVLFALDRFRNRVELADFPTPRWVLLPPDPTLTTWEQLAQDPNAPAPTDSGWVVTPRAGDGRLYIWFGDDPQATLRYVLDVR